MILLLMTYVDLIPYICILYAMRNYTLPLYINYSPNYTLHPDLSEYTIRTLNYNSCYTLHHAVN